LPFIRLDSVDATGGLNYPGMSISKPFFGNSPVFNVVPERYNSVLSVVHPIQPQNAGFTNSGTTSGIINTGSNAILYSGNGQAAWYTSAMSNRGTYTWPNWAETLRAAPAGTIAGATLNLPAVALDGRKLTLVCKNTISALTVKSPVGLINAPTTCRAGHHIDFQYSLPDNSYWAFN
jgi:hypothetical protein